MNTRKSPTQRLVVQALGLVGVVASLAPATFAQSAPKFPITPQQQQTAESVAQAGVPLSELAPGAPDAYTVKPGDTLWGIATLFLKSPWRWPELWGMNKAQVRNPHLIFPGQVLVLERSDGRARLSIGRQVDASQGSAGTIKLSPRMRAGASDDSLTAVPVRFLEAFFNEAVIFESADALAASPRLVATQEGRVMGSRGESIYVRGDLLGQRSFRLFRQPRALKDPGTGEILGFEAAFVGQADLVRDGAEAGPDGLPVPATLTVASVRQEAMMGDRLAPLAPRERDASPPHAPSQPVDGQIVSLYGEALTAGQNQIVTLNRGAANGIERGHVLALIRAGTVVRDTTPDGQGQAVRLPDERHGLLYVFRVFDRLSYALILQVKDPVKPGDRFTQP